MAYLNRYWDEYKDKGLLLVEANISRTDTRQMFNEYKQTYDVQYPTLMFDDGAGDLVQAVNCSTSNVTFLIYPDGTWSNNWLPGDLSKAVYWNDKTPPTAALTDPSTTMTLIAGETYWVKWTADDDYGIYRNDIYFSADGGQTYKRLEMMGSTMRAYLWKVSDVNSEYCKIKVVVIDVGQNETVLESPMFTVQGGNVGVKKQNLIKNNKESIKLESDVLYVPSVKNGVMKITGINGREVASINVSDNTPYYKIANSIPNGVYILSVRTQDINVNKKINLFNR